MKNNLTSFIITSGVLVLVIFSGVIYFNLIPSNESDSYYVRLNDDLSNKIELFDITNNNFHMVTKVDNIEYCIKTTKSSPASNNLCWNKIIDNEATMKVVPNKTYYLWIKDEGGNISDYLTISPADSEEE